jgi:phosphate-selective porin OprO/OprP
LNFIYCLEKIFMVLNNFIKAACLSTCLGLASGSILANANYNIDTNGGLKVYDKTHNDHWFQLNGKIKFDQTFFHGDISGPIQSSANLRSVNANLSGGIGTDTSYALNLSSKGSALHVDKANISYSGLNNWSKVSIGQVSSHYGLEGSSKFNSFLEKSVSTSIFAPTESGLGVSVDAWTDKVGMRWSMTQSTKSELGSESDPLSTSLRLSFAPLNTENLVFHLGFSGRYHTSNVVADTDGKGKVGDSNIRLSSVVEAKSRNTANKIDTGRINASSYHVVGLDAALQRGPVLLQAEYHRAHFNKNKNTDISLHGWNVQASYVLTGESHAYNYKTGGFTGISPDRESGAWEVSLRHSSVNLHKEDINGGEAKTFGGSIAWTANDNLTVLANYIHSAITPPAQLNGESEGKQTAGAFALRVQAAW